MPVPEVKAVKNRLHLDLRADGVTTAGELERLLALGARRVDVGQGPDVSWVVLSDPEGNEFCLLTPGGCVVLGQRGDMAEHDLGPGMAQHRTREERVSADQRFTEQEPTPTEPVATVTGNTETCPRVGPNQSSTVGPNGVVILNHQTSQTSQKPQTREPANGGRCGLTNPTTIATPAPSALRCRLP